MDENNDYLEKNPIVPDNEADSSESTDFLSEEENSQTPEYNVQYAEENPYKTEEKRRNGVHIAVVVLLILIFAAISTLTVYCICTDVKMGSIGFNKKNGGNNNFTLELKNKPESDKKISDVDENGRYTMEGLAKHIRPQIVEIYAFDSKMPDKAISGGSGIIISQDGYIVTNTHILDASTYTISGKEDIKADSYTVVTHDEVKYNARIVGRDKKTDIAVVKIDASGLPCAETGNSEETVIGERVAAIGNPEGLTGSITEGIVSGLDRKIKTDTTGFEMSCIQTDAAVSPGNSGGALVNIYGQIIGITSSKYSNLNSEGLGFAIAINDAKPIIEELISKGYVSGRVRIGVTFYSMDNSVTLMEFKDKYDKELPNELKGLWVKDIAKDCDIYNTELKVDDFILAVNGEKVSNYDELNVIIKGKKGGDTLKARCARLDKDMNISYFDIEFKLMSDTSGDY